MANRKSCLVPYDSIEFYAVENWLSAQAEKGWQLKRFCGGFAEFEASAPRKTRYCLDSLSSEKYDMEQELRETAAAQGWEYVSDYAWHSYGVYRSDDPDAVAFHSDLSIRQSAMRKRMVSTLLGLFVLACVIAHQIVRPGGLIALFRGASGSEVYLGNGLILIICAILLLLFWAVFAFISIGALLRAGRDLRIGRAGTHPSAAVQIVCRLFLTVCAIAVVVLLLVGRQYGYGQSQFLPLTDQDSLRVPLWQTIDPEEYHRAQEGRPDEVSFDDFMVIRHSPFAVEIVSIRQAGNYHSKNESSGVMESFYNADECVMRSDRYAERTLACLARENQCEPILPSDGFDEAAWGRYNREQTLVLRKDYTVIMVHYNGETDLREQISLFSEVLLQGVNK